MIKEGDLVTIINDGGKGRDSVGEIATVKSVGMFFSIVDIEHKGIDVFPTTSLEPISSAYEDMVL